MYSAIQTKFAEAVAKNKLNFTPSTELRKSFDSGVDAIFTTATALSQKPSKPKEQPETPLTDEQQSPWLPPDEDLLVKNEGEYNVVLNKFAVAKYHFLLVTKDFKKQSLPLGESDWEAAYKLLKQVNKESGKRHIGFFNCGPKSGASIAHRHLQFLTLPENFRPFPDSTEKVEVEGAATGDERIPFSHYIVGLKKDADAEEIVFRYSEVLGRVLTCISRATEGSQRPDINYNLVFTEEWIMATPRKADTTEDGLSVNALGTVGLLLAKSDEQREKLEERGFDIFAKELGYPFEKVVTHAPDFTGYTHY